MDERSEARRLYEERIRKMSTAESRRAAAAVDFAPGDVVIATPPKCGTTWVQQIVHQLRTGGSMDFREISMVIPFIELATDLGQAKWLDKNHDHDGFRPRVFKTHFHEKFLPTPATHQIKYIVVIRDPVEVASSFHDFMSKWLTVPPEPRLSVEEFVLTQFMDQNEPVVERPCGYFNFVAGWWARRFDPSVLFLFYEDMQANLEQSVRRIAKFLDMQLSEHRIQTAVRMSTFEFMKAHENKFNENFTKSIRNQAMGIPAAAGMDSSKVMVGARRPSLPETLTLKILQTWREVVNSSLGYNQLKAALLHETVSVELSVDEAYATTKIERALLQRGSRYRLVSTGEKRGDRCLFWKEYEELDFDKFQRERPSSELMWNSYCIRKGLIRKAQSHFYLSKYAAKRPESILNHCLPEAYLFELDDIDYLDEALADVHEVLTDISSEKPSTWILKSSIVDRASEMIIFNSVNTLQDALETKWNAALDDEEVGSASHLREWVVQRYVDTPLLAQGNRKFHLRVYVVACHDLAVYVYKPILALFAREPYDSRNLSHLAGHITNTCSTDMNGVPGDVVLSFWDLPDLAGSLKASIYADIKTTAGEVFKALVDEPAVFQPRKGAFEIYGLDFLVDSDGAVWYLEANAFPDFKQTGDDLQPVIEGLFDSVVEVIVDPWFYTELCDKADRVAETSPLEQVFHRRGSR